MKIQLAETKASKEQSKTEIEENIALGGAKMILFSGQRHLSNWYDESELWWTVTGDLLMIGIQ